ncbi:amino acid adenylation domain-containing protein [Colletotrichum graminicola M1.001]|uniref:Amino acid adenylation domain-containing protein n=1 Tax=Colletotrichum graminicola (strain M1.001 / M2 / FGSC 10212) TaxID=645133 RepID=E3Q509_COLGM|nr:amino acid adenylation domain-containing protein [Colletotrichum graminicola M1.001]EFQ25776.1 amino acid adenylation domain-containing protein [Colletotrichum graminicola M1.001]
MASNKNDASYGVQGLRTLLSQALHVPEDLIHDGDSFVSLGGDSFKAVRLYQKCTSLGMDVGIQDILKRPLGEIIAHADRSGCKPSQYVHSETDRFSLMPPEYDFGRAYKHIQENFDLAPDAIEDVYPCSPMQESMYISQKLSLAPLYRTRGLFLADQGLDLRELERAWSDVVQRHQSLRTVFVETSDPTSGRVLDAVILEKYPSTVTVTTDAGHVHEIVEKFHNKSCKAPSDRTEPNECRHKVTVYISGGQTLVEFDLSHLAIDGGSLTILVNDLTRALIGHKVDKPAPSYRRYIDYLQNQANEDAALDYWMEYLDGAEPCCFPAMNDNSAGDDGSSQVIEIMPAVHDKTLELIQAFCRSANTTVFGALQAVWALVLHAYTGDDDVCFGYLSSGRDLPIADASDIVGPMMSLLVCRVRDVADRTIGDLIDAVRSDFINAMPHQCFSLGKVRRILGMNETSRLFNTIVTAYHTSSTPVAGADGEVLKMIARSNTSEFDLVLKIVSSDCELSMRLAYATATLSRAMAERVSQTFSAFLERLVRVSGTAGCHISRIIGISPCDASQIFALNSITSGLRSEAVCVHELIERQARRRPAAPAIYAWDGEMSYRELDEAADVVVSHITSLGIGPGAYVALCFDKSLWYSVALLGVLKSGNAFVPIDVKNPTSRRLEILQQLGIGGNSGLVICSSSQASSLKHLSGHMLQLPCTKLDAKLRRPSLTVSVDHPAYVIFTSGSTGTPKGVAVNHRAYTYALQAHSGGIRIDQDSRVLQFASYGFDTSMEDHLTTLAVGACLCVPSDEDRHTLPGLASFARSSGANWAHLTPSFAAMLSPSLLPTIRYMVLGGEPMTADNIRTWSCPSPGPQLIQVYGPSECCVTSTITQPVLPDGDPTDIGTALPNCKTWIVKPSDPDSLQVVGAVGELLVEGPILAKGYLGDAERTSMAFVEGLRWAPDKRLYRTGDLVRYDSAGHLHFVGRRDTQVKLRGQRIELGEIERQLALNPSVQHCLLLVPGSGPCAGRLIAIVAPREAETPDMKTRPPDVSVPPSSMEFCEDTLWVDCVDDLRSFLVERLPAYMNPDIWVLVRAIPRNSSGKLDRRNAARWLEGLAAEDFSHLITLQESKSKGYRPTEQDFAMRRIWSEVLNIREDDVDYSTSFYHLGGDSISAMAVSSLAQSRGVATSPTDVLRHKTIMNITRAASKGKPPRIDTNKSTPSTDSSASEFVPLSPIQRLHFETSPQGDPFDQQSVVMQVTKKMDQNELLRAIESVFEAHPMLRARFECHDGVWKQRLPPTFASAAAPADSHDYRARFHSRDEPGYVLECIAESQASIDFVHGPLAAFDVFKAETQTLLSATIHHLVVDTVSWRILFRELEDFLNDETCPAPEATPFQAWSSAQCEFASELDPQRVLPVHEETLAVDLGFWGMDGKQNTHSHVTSRDLYVDERSCVPRNGTEHGDMDIVSTVLESFEKVFGRLPILFRESHGREPFAPHLDPSRTVGWFTTFCPVVVPKRRDDMTKSVHEARLGTPLNGLAYFASRFLSENGFKAFGHCHSPMEITVNYLGSFQQFDRSESVFRWCGRDLNDKVSNMRRRKRGHVSRYALISLLVVPRDRGLCLHVEWSTHMRHQDRINEWLSQLEEDLRQTRLDGQSTLKFPGRRAPFGTLMPSVFGMKRSQADAVLRLAESRLGLEPSQVESVYPCSPLQSSLMLSQLKQPGASNYEQRFVIKLSRRDGGLVDPNRLTAAWKRLVASHPIMRTIFLEDVSGTFIQAVLRSVDVQVDLLPTKKDASSLWAIWDPRLRCPEPLGGSVHHRLGIRVAADGSVYCLLAKNHLITDGTTSRLLIGNLIAAYDGASLGETYTFADYVDYICQQDKRAALRYWTSYLEGARPCCFPRLRACLLQRDQPADFVRASGVVPDTALVELVSRKLEVTRAAVFQAAWATVLSVYVGRDDVVFGLLSHGRNIPVPGAAEMIGPMASMVPMRVRLDGRTGMKEVVNAVHHDNIEHTSQQRAHLSLAEIQHTCGYKGGGMFNTILNYQKRSQGDLFASGSLRCELAFSRDTSEFDVAVSVTQDDDGFRITLESPAQFMSKIQAERLLAVYLQAVLQICVGLDRRPPDLELSTTLDMQQVVEWNKASSQLETSRRCIHDMIDETADRQPSSPAISSWDGDLSYTELNDLSRRLVSRLQTLGTRPGAVVVLCFEKSLWAVVSMLAVARSGAAFVHIDPAAPSKRIESIVGQTKPALGLGSAAGYERLSPYIRPAIIVDRSLVEGIPSVSNIYDVAVDPGSVLYICFTSGTTGTPKGVVIPHESFCSAVASNSPELQITAKSRVLQFTHFCFDASLEETFTVLVAGGCICIPSEEERMSDLAGFVTRKSVNWAAFTPSLLRTLNPDELASSVCFITVHAEPMCADLVSRWASKVHMRPSYGPTECSVTSTVGARMTAHSDPANIGHPVGCHAWIVHPENHRVLAPVGAVGELVLDGPIVGNGYWGDEAKTGEAFVESSDWWGRVVDSPEPCRSRRRVYKTGDLVRYAEDGSLLIQGRKDDSQVKIRGQRVELREIQHHMDNLPDTVRCSMALVPASGILSGRLVAVASIKALQLDGDTDCGGLSVITKNDLGVEGSWLIQDALDDITTFLADHLPRYLIPDTWLLVRSLPVQTSFKLDRQRVGNWVAGLDRETLEAALEVQRKEGSKGQRGTATEEIIRSIWAKVLCTEADRIGLDETFFRLGGDSIHAIETVRLYREAGLDISTYNVLANPTVRGLAAILAESASRKKLPTRPQSPEVRIGLLPSSAANMPQSGVIQEDNVEAVLTCTPLQSRMYTAFLQMPQNPYLVNNLVSLGLLDSDTVARAWQCLVDRHGILRSVFIGDPLSGHVYQKVLKKWVVDISSCSVRCEADAVEHSRRHLQTARTSFLHNNLPPLSICIYSLSSGILLAHLVFGHVLLDHVSLYHLLADFGALAHSQTLAPDPAPAPAGFGTYTRYLEKRRDLDDCNAYWAEQLRGVEPCCVPVEPAATVVDQGDPHATGIVRFSVSLTGAVHEFLRETETTLSNLLQLAWAILLHLYLDGRQSVLFGHLVSDRDIHLPQVQEIVGPMLAMMVTRLELNEDMRIEEAIKTLQSDFARGFQHRTFDLTVVERELGHRRGGLFNTMVNYRKVKFVSHAGIEVRSIWSQDPHEQILVLAFNDGAVELDASITFYKSLYTEATAAGGLFYGKVADRRQQ